MAQVHGKYGRDISELEG